MRMKTLAPDDAWIWNRLIHEQLAVCDSTFTVKFRFCVKAGMDGPQTVKSRLTVKNSSTVKILSGELGTSYRDCTSAASGFSLALLLVLVLLLYFH